MVNIRLDDGRVIKRKVTGKMFGNFCMLMVRYNNDTYLIGDGDEYIRGYSSNTYTLGRKLTPAPKSIVEKVS